jgi:hypothetical protein
MGTPDMEGSFGTFSFFTNDPAEKRTQVAGGRIVRVGIKGGRAILPVEGPANGFRRDHAIAKASLTAYIDRMARAARFDIDGQQVVLKQGEWSDWLTATFRLLPGIKSTSGVFRLYPDGRLGGSDGALEPGSLGAVPDHLRLDTAAFLGTGDRSPA